eukprot:6230958-Pyramimonas_sp.AAC.2
MPFWTVTAFGVLVARPSQHQLRGGLTKCIGMTYISLGMRETCSECRERRWWHRPQIDILP